MKTNIAEMIRVNMCIEYKIIHEDLIRTIKQKLNILENTPTLL